MMVDVIDFSLGDQKSGKSETYILRFEIPHPNFFLNTRSKDFANVFVTIRSFLGDWKSRNCSNSQVVDSWVCLTQAAKRCHESNGGFKGANGAGWSG